MSISKESMDFLCSEEGFQKMKQDGADLFIKNETQKKENAKDKNPDDPFWENTINQRLVFSEMLYNNGFYTGMTDEEVDQFEDTLAHIICAGVMDDVFKCDNSRSANSPWNTMYIASFRIR